MQIRFIGADLLVEKGVGRKRGWGEGSSGIGRGQDAADVVVIPEFER
jgi:tryptophan 2,3-dioxygenase